MNASSTLSTEFRPHPALRGPHAQTLAGFLLGSRRLPYRAQAHHVTLDDGDIMVLHEDLPERPKRRGAVLLHGLAGCHGSPYMQRLADKLPRRGYHVFRLDLRGCGAGLRLAKGSFHAGCSRDVEQVLEFIERDLYPRMPLTLVGYSLGGNVALKLLGELGGHPRGGLDSAIAVAPPVDLSECSRRLSSGAGVFYERFFLRWLRAHVEQRSQWVPEIQRLAGQTRPRTLRQFDDQITAPLGGFAGVDDYYHRSSSGPLLPRIQVPTRILAAADDPLVPANVLRQVERSPHVRLHIMRHGGHLGFIGAANGDPDRRWMDWRIVDWLDEFSQGTGS